MGEEEICTDRAEGDALALEDPDQDGREHQGEEAVSEDEAVGVGEVLAVPVLFVCVVCIHSLGGLCACREPFVRRKEGMSHELLGIGGVVLTRGKSGTHGGMGERTGQIGRGIRVCV